MATTTELLENLKQHLQNQNEEDARQVIKEGLSKEHSGFGSGFMHELVVSKDAKNYSKQISLLCDEVCKHDNKNELIHTLILEAVRNGGAKIQLGNNEDEETLQAEIIFIHTFLNQGIEINKPFIDNTTLDLAIKSGKINMIELAQEYGADLSLTNIKGDSPIHTALTNHSNNIGKANKIVIENDIAKANKIAIAKVVERLMQLGADVNQRNKEGKLPLELVSEGDNFALIKQLAKYTMLDKNDPKDKAVIDKLANNGFLSDEELKSIQFKTPSRPNTPVTSPKQTPEPSPPGSPRDQRGKFTPGSQLEIDKENDAKHKQRNASPQMSSNRKRRGTR